MARIFTSTYNYDGPNRLDITVKGKDSIGVIFAPTWAMVNGIKTGEINWEQYKDLYHRMMFRSYADNRETWEEVMSREAVVLVCFCADHTACHRSLLASIFAWLGHDYVGELKKTS
jgi:hypothetical protein